MFKLDSPLMTILNKVADILILNIIFIIACVPIVTIGAAFSAAYYIGFKMVKDEESYIVRGFFKAFKDNFKQATIIWLILMVVLGVLFADFRIMAYSGIEFAAWMKVAMGAVTLFLVIGIYLAQFVFNGVVASANGSTVNWCLCGACALGIFSAKINAYICIACSWWDTVLPVILIVAGVS